MQTTKRYIAFLRGINVGGHTVKMDRLRDFFKELSLQNVRTYIQSGNVFFETTNPNKVTLRSEIEKHLLEQLGFPVSVCLRTIEEVEKVLQLNPFKDITLTPDTRFSVIFLATPSKEKIPEGYTTPDGGYELIYTTPTELFVVWHIKNGRPGNSYRVLETMVKTPTTTRFWHTTEKILTAAKGI